MLNLVRQVPNVKTLDKDVIRPIERPDDGYSAQAVLDRIGC